jgi:DNA-binding transcriptional ArsR family regulator
MSQVEPPARAKEAAPLFAALGDATRLGLLLSLSAQGPLSVTRLGAPFAVSRQALTKHLEVLAGAGLVRSRRQGRERIWELEPRCLDEAHQCLEGLSRQWDAALDRLRTFVER